MDSEQFCEAGKQMIDYVIKYLETIRDRRVYPNVRPGFMREMIPTEAPEQGEKWEDVFADIERVIMPGVTHWHSPRFSAFFPTGSSYPAILADILSDAIGCTGFSWATSPSCTELEVVMLDWLGKLIQLPKEFLACSGGSGGGVIQGTASEATLVALLAAKARVARRIRDQQPEPTDTSFLGRLVCYASDQSHSSVERAALLGSVKIRLIRSDANFSFDVDALEKAMEVDVANGLIPFFAVATLGTTPSCAFDDLKKLGPVCRKNDLWLHVDAAYAGSAFVCPEFRHFLDGVEHSDSFNFNPHKWMLVNFDCSVMWVKNSNELVDAHKVDPLYLRHEYQGLVPDYRHWQIPFGRRFRALKLWFVMRIYGAEGIRKYIRDQVSLAKEFESLVRADERFEIVVPVHLGLVCFRLKGPNGPNEQLLKHINDSGKIYVTPSMLHQTFVIRFCICASRTNLQDIEYSWNVIRTHADQVLSSNGQGVM